MREDRLVDRRSSTLFGIHSENKAMEDLKNFRAQNRRFSFIAAAVILLLLIILICLIVVNLYSNVTSASNNNRTTEHLNDIMTAQPWKLVQDIQLQPQSDTSFALTSEKVLNKEGLRGEQTYANREQTSSDRRWERRDGNSGDEEQLIKATFANHKYTDEERQPEERAGWKPRPFKLTMDDKNVNINKLHKILNEASNETPITPIGFTPPVRFRGVYVHPKPTPLQAVGAIENERNQEYYQKINDLFERHRKAQEQEQVVDGESASNSASQSISQFNSDHLTKVMNPTGPSSQESIQHSWNRKKTRPKTKPFTVMLDIYPMNRDEEDINNMNKNNVKFIRKPKEAIFIPIRPGEEYFRPEMFEAKHIPQIILPPKQKRKNSRMLMKLNLFPRGNAPHRRTWSMFSRQQDEEENEEGAGMVHGCHGIIGHNPFGKPITAKWKNKNGETIHAKFVTMQQWEDSIDEKIDPR